MSCARGLWSWGPIDEAIQRLQRRPELLNVGGNVGVLRAETPVGWVSLLRLWLPRAWWLLDHIATACITGRSPLENSVDEGAHYPGQIKSDQH